MEILAHPLIGSPTRYSPVGLEAHCILSGCILPDGGAATSIDVFHAVLLGLSDGGVIGVGKLTLSMVAELKSHALPLACAETVMGMTHHSKQWV